MQIKRGFIMVYTIFIGIICLIIMMYIFDLQASELKYSVSVKKHVLKEDNYQKYREYLMTLFYAYVDKNNNVLKSKGIKDFFCNTNSVVVDYENANVTYKKSDNQFIFKIPYDSLILRNDYFRLETINECLELVFIKTEYTNIRPGQFSDSLQNQ